MNIDDLWAQLRPDDAGLIAAVVVHAIDARVLMLGYMNRDALAATLDCGHVTFWSRSRASLWEKGESSGHTLELEDLRIDCDGDALLVRAHPRGPTCHTGTASCFFRPLVHDDGVWKPAANDDGPVEHALRTTERSIQARARGEGMTNSEGKSYVRSLLAAGTPMIRAKILEESQELCEALATEDDDRVASEAADLLFHVLVGLSSRGLDLRSVDDVLRRRHGRSGIDEKASRQSK